MLSMCHAVNVLRLTETFYTSPMASSLENHVDIENKKE